MGPYLSAIWPKVTCGGFDPPKRWRWPIKGHAPLASGGAFLVAALWFLGFLDRDEKTKRNNNRQKNEMASDTVYCVRGFSWNAIVNVFGQMIDYGTMLLVVYKY